MQQTMCITPQFVTYPPPPDPEETVTELPRDHSDFDEGYGEFAIGDTFYIDNPRGSEGITEYEITGFEGFKVDTYTDTEAYTSEHVQILCRDAHDIDADERAFEYRVFCDAVYRLKFVTFTSPDYLVDDINTIIVPPEPEEEPQTHAYAINHKTGKPTDLASVRVTAEFVETIASLQSYYYDM